MFRRLAQSAFYLLLLASGEEFDAVVVDTYSAQQYAGERYEPCWQRCASQPLPSSFNCSRNSSTTD